MKKLMIAAAVAAVGMGAFAADACSPVTKTSAWVYQWKFSGKTTWGNKDVGTIGTLNCVPVTGQCTYRVKTSLKIQGYTFACDVASCSDDELGLGGVNFPEVNEVFWQTKPWKDSLFGGVTVELANIIGKNKKQAEVAGTAEFTPAASLKSTYDLVFAGFGKFDTKNKRVKSASGNFAGFLSQPVAPKFCIDAGVWDCTTLQLVCEAPSVAFGKWSMKFKKSAAKKYANQKGLKYPSWVVAVNAL